MIRISPVTVRDMAVATSQQRIFKQVELKRFVCYNANVTASDTGDRKEVSSLDTITSFLVAVMAGVACHCINKWLDKR